MKKTLLIIYLVIILFINMGCEKKVEYDHKSAGWELWATGVVDKTYIELDGSNRIFFIEFEGELKFKTSRFHNFNEVKEKTKGSIYKWTGLTSCYYMWVPDNDFMAIPTKKETVQTPIYIIAAKPKINNTEISVPPIKYEWQNAKAKQPPLYQTVLVKFEDGIVITAYCTQAKVWKSEIDKRKMSGGIALKNIVQWKMVDLE